MGELITKSTALTTPFYDEGLHLEIPPGLTIAEVLDHSKIHASMWPQVRIHLNGLRVPVEQWRGITLQDEDVISIFVVPFGGGGDSKNIFRLIATIAVAIVATVYLGPMVGALYGKFAGAAAAAAFTLVGTMAINALIPPPSNRLTGGTEQDSVGNGTYFSGQSNRAAPHQIIPVIYGNIRMTGILPAQPSVIACGLSSVYTAIYDFGLGDLIFGNILVGESPLEQYVGGWLGGGSQEYRHYPRWQANRWVPLRPKWLQYPVKYDETRIDLVDFNDSGSFTTADGSESAVIEIMFPQGLVEISTETDSNGNTIEKSHSITLSLEYRKELRDGAGNIVTDPALNPWLSLPSGTTACNPDNHLNPGLPNEPPPNLVFVPEMATNARMVTDIGLVIDQNHALAKGFHVDVTARNGEHFFYPQSTASVKLIYWDTGLEVPLTITGKAVITIVAPGERYRFTFPNMRTTSEIGWIAVKIEASDFNDQLVGGQPHPQYAVRGDPIFADLSRKITSGDSGGGAGDPGDPGGGGGTINGDFDETFGNETFVEVQQQSYNATNEFSWQTSPNVNHTLALQGEFSTITGMAVIEAQGDFVKVMQQWNVGSIWYRIARYSVSADYQPGYDEFGHVQQMAPRALNYDTFEIYGSRPEPGAVSIFVPFPTAGRHEIKITRKTPEPTASRIIDRAIWTKLISRGSEDSDQTPILDLKLRHSMLEIQFQSSEELSGNVAEISALCQAHLRYRGNTSWFGPHPTRNLIEAVLDVLTGYCIQNRGVPPKTIQDNVGWVQDAQIDFDSFNEMRLKCDEQVSYVDYDGRQRWRPRYTFDAAIATDAPIIETVQSMLAMARCRLIINQQGKIACLEDKPQTIPRALLTPSNSWGFKGSRDFSQLPDGLRVWFNPRELNFQRASLVVYRPGKTESTSELIDEIEAFGCTDYNYAELFGRYMLAQGILRSETFTINVEIESLVLQVGDLCRIQHDTPLLGGVSCYVKELNGNQVVLDRPIGTFAGQMVYTWRTSGGMVTTGQINAAGDDWVEPAGVVNFLPGDLVVIGEETPTNDAATDEYLVTSIQPAADFTAQLTLVRYDEAVYNTDYGEFPGWDPGFGVPPTEESYLYINSLKGVYNLDYVDRYPWAETTLTWDVLPSVSQDGVGAIKIDFEPMSGGLIPVAQLTGESREFVHHYPLTDTNFGSGYYIVTPLSLAGYEGKLGRVFVSVRADHTPPPVPTGFVAEWQYNGTTRLRWNKSTAPDMDMYKIYRSPTDSGVDGAQFVSNANWDATSHFVPDVEEWWYYIVAIDTSGNRSGAAAVKATHPIPDTPENFNLAINGSTGVLSWTRLPDPWVTLYKIYYNPDERAQYGDLGTVFVGQTGATASSFAIEGKFGSYFLVAENVWDEQSTPARTSTYVGDLGVHATHDAQQLIHRDRYPYSRVRLTWSAFGATSLIDHYEVEFIDSTGEVRLLGTTTSRQRYVDFDIIRDPATNSGEFVVTPVTVFGSHGVVGRHLFSSIRDNVAPEAPKGFFANVHNNVTVDMNWMPSISNDVGRYVARYSPNILAAEWDGSELLAELDHTTTNLSVHARTGTYMLACYDTSGNRSEIQYQRTTIADLPDLNVVETWNDRLRNWPGAASNLVPRGTGLVTTGTFVDLPDGNKVLAGLYTSDVFVDLLDVFELRLVSKIQTRAERLGGAIATWPNLAAINPIAGQGEVGAWESWAEYRVADSVDNMIVDWATLAAVPVMGGINQIEWSAWRRFTSTDVTGRYFQFRIVAESLHEDTVVVIDDGLIELDMEDRVWSESDIQVTTAGVQIDFLPPFLQVKAVAVTIDGNSDAVIAELTNKQPNGVFVRLINTTTGNPVAGQIDVIATGYGRLRLTSVLDGGYTQQMNDHAGGWADNAAP